MGSIQTTEDVCSQKLINFLLGNFRKFVWEGRAVIPRDEVAVRGPNSGGDTQTTGRRDMECWSLSPKSRRSMFGKGGQRPKAQAVRMSASLGDVSRQYWPAIGRHGHT